MQASRPSNCVNIDLGERSYPILIDRALLADPATYADLPSATSALIVTNSTVEPLYGAQLRAALQGKFRKIFTVILPDGEAHKDWPAVYR